jgi:hypothetical protein
MSRGLKGFDEGGGQERGLHGLRKEQWWIERGLKGLR